MSDKPTHCICGTKLVLGEAEIETKSGIMMLVPAFICLNEDCDAGFFVESDVVARADKLAKLGIKAFIPDITLPKN